jgi:hypothetical protein
MQECVAKLSIMSLGSLRGEIVAGPGLPDFLDTMYQMGENMHTKLPFYYQTGINYAKWP